MTKFYERNCDAFAVKIWEKAYPESDHAHVVDSLFHPEEGSITRHIAATPTLDVTERAYNPEYSYGRFESLKSLILKV